MSERALTRITDEGSIAAVATEDGASTIDAGVIDRFGFERGMIIQEFGYDDDADEALRTAIEDLTGEDLADEDFGDVTDGALVWFRDGDEDLADMLMDVQSLLDDGASVWLLTPKAGTTGHVLPGEVQESSSLAGLHATSTFVVGEGWSCTQLVEKGRSK
ncbi:DUF3052 domain-containing protein [Demequina sp. NBRC 110056]|uniref:DUF3052 domain-containing protein n=1 Tax=Demequina sp. NBRC 110056 TaxID=1570345 RepID=UPI001F36D396|nr:DUF3052 domain-containing protein [Demequina sp. NBRC 110056]